MRLFQKAAVMAATLFLGTLTAQTIDHPRTSPLPVTFVENNGQFDAEARFAVRHGGMTTFLTADAFVVQTSLRDLANNAAHGVNLFFTFEGANAVTAPAGGRALGGKVSYLLGDVAERWVIGAPTWREVTVSSLYRGCDLRFHGDRGAVEYDLHVAPGVDPRVIVIRCDGAESIAIDATGALIAHTAIGDVRQAAPTTWSIDAHGTRTLLPCRYRMLDDRRFTFEIEGRDQNDAILIDPTLAFAGYLSGSGGDECTSVALDATGATYLAGRTGSANFPKTPGAFDSTFNGSFEGFVTKINPAGTAMVYSTYIGSPGTDNIEGMIVDSAGLVTITGNTGSGFPVTAGAYDTTYAGWKECFVARLNTTGTGLVFSTFIGGGHEDVGNGLAVDLSGNIYVAGQTQSTNFPATTGSFDTTANGSWDAFLVKLNPTASTALFATLLGGSGIDWAYDVAIAPNGEPVICGGAGSTNFPTTTGAFDTTPNGSMDAFVSRFTTTGGLVFSTMLGSSGSDQAMDIAVDSTGAAYVTGACVPGFPTTPAAYDISNNNGDAFVTKLAANGSSLVYSTFVGGSGTEQGTAIAVDASGAAFVAGYTNSTNLAVTASALQPTYGGGGAPGDALVAKVNPAGTALDYCSYYGGAGYEDARGIAIDTTGGIVFGGSGVSTTLPVTATPFAGTFGIDEAFFAKVTLSGLATVGTIGPGCAPTGPLPSTSSQNPVLGSTIMLSGSNAPSGAVTQIWVSNPVPTGTLPNGCPFYVNAGAAVLASTTMADAAGNWQVNVVMPSQAYLNGTTLNAQAVSWTATSPWGYELASGVALTLGY